MIYVILEFLVDEELIKNYQKLKKNILAKEQEYLDYHGAQDYIKTKNRRFFNELYNKSVLAGEVYSEKSRKLIKPVFQFSENGELLDVFNNSLEAEHYTKIDSTSIRRVCQGKRLKAGNFYWSNSDVLIIKISSTIKPINQYSKEKVFIKRYNSISEAQLSTKIDIRKEKIGRIKRQGGFYWLFDNEDFPIIKREFVEKEVYLKCLEYLKEPVLYGRRRDFIKDMNKEYGLTSGQIDGYITRCRQKKVTFDLLQ